jgi:diketogulonate reductase-like aldo/keto reductase
MKSNRGNWGFKLSKEDMEELDSLNKSKEGRTPSEGGLGSRTLTFTDSTATRPLYALI